MIIRKEDSGAKGNIEKEFGIEKVQQTYVSENDLEWPFNPSHWHFWEIIDKANGILMPPLLTETIFPSDGMKAGRLLILSFVCRVLKLISS